MNYSITFIVNYIDIGPFTKKKFDNVFLPKFVSAKTHAFVPTALLPARTITFFSLFRGLAILAITPMLSAV